jgi:transposase
MWNIAAMAKTFREWSPEQDWLLPPSVSELVPRGHLAHFVRDTVREELDLSGILSSYTEERGYPPYHPALMTALLLYGYSVGIYSSRRLDRACQERVDFMAVTGRETPDFRTIAAFRRRHLKALRGLFVQVVALCQRAGLVSLGHVALDGTKIQANASKHKAMSYERMKMEERRLKAEVGAWLDRAESADRLEDRDLGEAKRGDELPAWVADKEKRREKIREARASLEAEAKEAAMKEQEERDKKGPRGPSSPGPEPAPIPTKPDPKAQRNFTDPQSRILKAKDGFIQGYNAQAVVDADSQVIVAEDVIAQQNDVGHAVAMIEQVRENVGRYPKELSADAGYCSEANLKAILRRRIRGYVATGRQVHGATSATNEEGRKQRPHTIAMRARLRRGGHRSRYRLRKQTVEPVFGQAKHARGFRQFLLRGLDQVRGEWSLVSTAHNLLKLFRAQVVPATA